MYVTSGGRQRALVLESIVAMGFVFVALLGFKRNLCLVAVACVGHGLFDLVHGSVIENPGVPIWRPGACLAFDVLFGAWVAALLLRRSRPSLSRIVSAHRQF